MHEFAELMFLTVTPSSYKISVAAYNTYTTARVHDRGQLPTLSEKNSTYVLNPTFSVVTSLGPRRTNGHGDQCCRPTRSTGSRHRTKVIIAVSTTNSADKIKVKMTADVIMS